MAILEGMASGLPLVATAVGDVPTVVRDGRTGILVPSENVECLAAAIVELLRDASLRMRLGSAAKSLIAEEFSAERMATNYLRVYEDALAPGKTGSSSAFRSATISGEKDEVKKVVK